MKSSAAINAITNQIEQNSRNKYYKRILKYYAAFVAIVILFYSSLLNWNFSANNWLDSGLNNFYSILLTFGGSIIFPLVYFKLSRSEKNNYKWFRRIVLITHFSLRYPSTKHLYSMIKRIFFSFASFVIIVVFTGPFLISNINGVIFPDSATGLILAYYSFVFFASYGVIALPRMIAIKTGKSNHTYFYWLQFYKSMLVSSPTFIYLSFGLFIVINLLMGLFTFKTNFEIKEIWSSQNLSTLISLFGVWLAIIIAMANDFLRNYNRLDKCYEDQTTYTLRKHIIDPNKFDYILLGMGNLGKIVGGFLIPEILKKQTENLDEPMRYFECIIDRDYELRVFPRNVIVIEKNNALFEETRFDSNSGLTYGFINGKDLVFEMANKQRLPSSLVVFSLNGDGGYLPILKLADYDKSKVIINTTSDNDMGLKLKMTIDREKYNHDTTTPIVISTVEDSSTYSYLERNESTTIFPMHAGSIEGNSIATRLFTLVMNMTANGKDIHDIHLHLIGNGKTMYYTLNVFIKLLSTVYDDPDFITDFIENQLTIITNDAALDEEISPYAPLENDSYPQRYQWSLHFDKKRTFKIRLVFQDPTGYHTLLNAFEWNTTDFITNEKEALIIFTTRNTNDAIRICQNIKQITNEYKLNKIGILASVSIEIAANIEALINESQPLKEFLADYDGFPSQIKDVIIKKNLIIGSQIISISDSLKNTFTSESDDSFLKDSISGEIALCISDDPGSFCKLLTHISGLSEPVITKGKLFPSFYNNYTYTLRLKNDEDKHMFIFRGDVYLPNESDDKKPKPFKIHGYTLNGSPVFRKELRNLIEKICAGGVKGNSPGCGFNNRCAVSAGCDNLFSSTSSKSANLNEKSFATIKILADCDHVQGSLAVAIADFLMIGENLEFNKDAIESNTVDIAYENCSMCFHAGKSINRLYINIKENQKQTIEKLRLQYQQDHKVNLSKMEIADFKQKEKIYLDSEKERKENMKSLLINRNIIAIKIKPVMYSNQDWKNYGKDLLEYLNGLSSYRTYTKFNGAPEITIYDKNVSADVLDYIKNIL
jgi:hypothetical protein